MKALICDIFMQRYSAALWNFFFFVSTAPFLYTFYQIHCMQGCLKNNKKTEIKHFVIPSYLKCSYL